MSDDLATADYDDLQRRALIHGIDPCAPADLLRRRLREADR